MLPGRRREDPGAAPPTRLLRIAEPPEAVHEDGVVSDGIRRVEDPSEELVVARRGQRQIGADGLLLGAGVTVPATLEVEEGAVAIGEGHLTTVRRVPAGATEQRGASSG